jgi:hypothetical protein
MTTIRQRLAGALLGREVEQMRGMVQQLTQAYLFGPFEEATSPEALKRTLKEYDSALVQDLVNDIEWERMGVSGYDPLGNEARRQRAVKESRRLWIHDVVTSMGIQLWTDFGFGEQVTIEPHDVKADGAWDAYWDSDENDAVLGSDNVQALSENMLVDGEVFLAYYVSTLDGSVTVRSIDTLEITEIVADPDDERRPLFYKRQWTPGPASRAQGQQTAYYPAWQVWLARATTPASELADPYAKVADRIRDVERADLKNPATVVLVQHLAYKRKGGLRGWPLTTAAAPWSREHRRFRENRASIAAAVGMWVQKIKAQGGSRAIDAIKAKLGSSLALTGRMDMMETNPPAPAGSTFLENDKATLEKLPLGTNASDAQFDGAALLMMAGLGLGVYPHYLGAGESFRLATATAMEAPLHRQWSRYQQFWSATFRRMLRIVLAMDTLYGSKRVYQDTGADVSTDRLIEVDLSMISEAVDGLLTSGAQPYYEAGLIDDNLMGRILATIWRTALQALGSDDPGGIASDEAFGVTEEPTEAAVAEHRPFRGKGTAHAHPRNNGRANGRTGGGHRVGSRTHESGKPTRLLGGGPAPEPAAEVVAGAPEGTGGQGGDG